MALMVTFSPLLWYDHNVFLLLPYALLLFASPAAYWVLGLLALSLVQFERYFEFGLIDFPWPVVSANPIVLTITPCGFVRIQRHLSPIPIITLDAITYTGNPRNPASLADPSRYTFLKANICDLGLVRKVAREQGVSTIISFPADTHIDRSIPNPTPGL